MSTTPLTLSQEQFTKRLLAEQPALNTIKSLKRAAELNRQYDAYKSGKHKFNEIVEKAVANVVKTKELNIQLPQQDKQSKGHITGFNAICFTAINIASDTNSTIHCLLNEQERVNKLKPDNKENKEWHEQAMQKLISTISIKQQELESQQNATNTELTTAELTNGVHTGDQAVRVATDESFSSAEIGPSQTEKEEKEENTTLNLQSSLERKDEYISELEAKAAEKNKHISELEAKAVEKNKHISELEAKAVEKDEQAKQLQLESKAKDDHIAQLQKTEGEKNVEIKDLTDKLTANKKLFKLRVANAVKNQTARITELEAEVKEKNDIVTNLQFQLAEQKISDSNKSEPEEESAEESTEAEDDSKKASDESAEESTEAEDDEEDKIHQLQHDSKLHFTDIEVLQKENVRLWAAIHNLEQWQKSTIAPAESETE